MVMGSPAQNLPSTARSAPSPGRPQPSSTAAASGRRAWQQRRLPQWQRDLEVASRSKSAHNLSAGHRKWRCALCPFGGPKYTKFRLWLLFLCECTAHPDVAGHAVQEIHGEICMLLRSMRTRSVYEDIAVRACKGVRAPESDLQAAEEFAQRAATDAEAAEDEDPPLQVRGCPELAKSWHQQTPSFLRASLDQQCCGIVESAGNACITSLLDDQCLRFHQKIAGPQAVS